MRSLILALLITTSAVAGENVDKSTIEDSRVVSTTSTQAIVDRAVLALRVEILAKIEAQDKAVAVALDNVNRFPTLLDREITSLKLLFEQQILTSTEPLKLRQQEIFTTLNGGSIPLIVQVKENEGKLAKLDIQFQERTAASSTAIAAALQAAKELVAQYNSTVALAVDKSNVQTAEAIRQLSTLTAAENKALSATLDANKLSFEQQTAGNKANADQRIADLQSRLDKAEGNRGGVSDLVGWIFGGLGIIIAFAAMMFAIPRSHAIRKEG